IIFNEFYLHYQFSLCYSPLIHQFNQTFLMISPFIFTKIQIQQIAFSNRDFIQREKIAKIFNCQHDINSTSISVRIFIKFFEICNKYPFSIGATIRGQDLFFHHLLKKHKKYRKNLGMFSKYLLKVMKGHTLFLN